jgi:phage repressor protein C with HTH and peptisase S24 domain
MAELIKSAGSLVAAGEIAGTSDETLAKWRDGQTRPSFFGLAALAAAAGRSLDWLLYGESAELRELQASMAFRAQHDLPGDFDATVVRLKETMERASRGHDLADFALIPRYNVQASAGSGVVAVDESEIERIAFRLDWLREIGIDPKEAGLLTATGDSMSPTIPDGALMLVDRRKDQQLRSGYIYVIVLDGEVLVKRLSRNVDKTIDLISDNPLYPVKTIRQVDFDGLFIAGRVFWVGRKL